MNIPATLEELEQLAEKTRISYIKITTSPDELAELRESKIGGIPYWKKSLDYPEINGKPAKLMAQINFTTLNENGLNLPDFPDKGLLQFYCPTKGWGRSNYKDKETDIKVIYHEDISEISFLSDDMEDIAMNEKHMPYKEPCIFDFELKSQLLGASDSYQCAKYYDFDILDLSDELSDEMYEGQFVNSGSKIGGYASFMQDDPRDIEERKDWVLLLQIDSDDNIMWGDSGVANWFIEREDLKKRDFSKVFFSWDCC